MSLSLPARWARMCSFAAVLMLAACGGDVGSGGTGSPMSAHAVGTVNGLGSVIVDGITYDDRDAPRVQETSPGVDTPADVGLGMRVDVEHQRPGVAELVRIEPTLVGPVASVAAPGRFTVLGQTVVTNADPAAGPVTQLVGYASIADLAAGDAVEVHGMLAGQGVQATRVQRLAALPAYLRASGTVASLSGAQFRLGALVVDTSAATLRPAGSVLADGRSVSVMAPASALGTDDAGNPRLLAAQVRLKSTPAQPADVTVSGEISSPDAVAKTFVIDGLRVDHSTATVSPPGAVIGDDVYVRVEGTLQTDGTLRAGSVAVIEGSAATEAQLKGTISGHDAVAGRFTIRGVAVTIGTAQVEGCPATSWDGRYAEVEGSPTPGGVTAREIHCTPAEPSGAVVEREGTCGTVDLAARTFVLTREGSSVTVSWSASTYFSRATPETLAGRRAHVEGVLEGGVLEARKVLAED